MPYALHTPNSGETAVSLPTEIRIMIYENLLVVRKGIYIKELPGIYRTGVFQCHPALCKRDWSLANVQPRKRHARFRPPTLESLSKFVIQEKLGITAQSETGPIKNVAGMRKMLMILKNEQGPGIQYKIWLSILAMCKDVYAEAVHFVYRQRFTFADTGTLHNFVMLLGPAAREILGDIQILGWEDKRSITSGPIPAFSVLKDVVNLRRLHVCCSIGVPQDWAWVNVFPPRKTEPIPRYHHPTDMIASKIYRDCAHWLRPMFIQSGMHEIKQVLRLDKRNFMPVLRTSQNPLPAFTREMYQEMKTRFWAYLEILLAGNVM
ncbi:hypothetical protein CMQ_7665 [Grosmannia clavigera kw1407]|uniref:Uncharacterized protein n=1 Tax=Grosmannia clavigera (strain kw1407 / UAMH 11150) TaxID=655863 RepID=F0XNW9_GROCL|nr:uncharacterized protein CMQ_7665 [Grosmannia clavigera kw1407]EFX00663.1 hypothetical protein CMQ_7665 [Grosmannia clavigera kw1407]